MWAPFHQFSSQGISYTNLQPYLIPKHHRAKLLWCLFVTESNRASVGGWEKCVFLLQGNGIVGICHGYFVCVCVLVYFGFEDVCLLLVREMTLIQNSKDESCKATRWMLIKKNKKNTPRARGSCWVHFSPPITRSHHPCIVNISELTAVSQAGCSGRLY